MKPSLKVGYIGKSYATDQHQVETDVAGRTHRVTLCDGLHTSREDFHEIMAQVASLVYERGNGRNEHAEGGMPSLTVYFVSGRYRRYEPRSRCPR